MRVHTENGCLKRCKNEARGKEVKTRGGVVERDSCNCTVYF